MVRAATHTFGMPCLPPDHHPFPADLGHGKGRGCGERRAERGSAFVAAHSTERGRG